MIFVHTLGAARIDAGAARYEPRSERKFALLLHLAAERGRRVPRSALQDFLFPDRTERNGQHSLRQLVYSLRESGIPIESDVNGIELATEAVRSDYSEVMERDRPDVAQLEAAAGGFLPGYAPDHSEAFAEWFEGYRAKSVFELCKAILREVQRAKRGGDWQLMEKAARACLGLDPLNEEATLALAEILAVGGAKVAAVSLLDRYIAEVGQTSPKLTLPAGLVRRRISEKTTRYSSSFHLPFVARRNEMAELLTRLDWAQAGSTQLAVVWGEPGIGKSRLASEFCTYAELQGCAVEHVSMQPLDAARPMSAFVDAVPRITRLPGALGVQPQSVETLRSLTTLDSDVRSAPTASAALNARYAQATRAVADLIDAVAAERPLVLWIDDAQWLDDESLEVVHHLADQDDARSLLILLTQRQSASLPERATMTGRAISIRLNGLGEADARQIATQVLENNARASTEYIDWLLQAADGNPFFLHSLLAHYCMSGQQFVVPRTVSDLVELRLRGLEPDERNVLEACALLGRYSTLARIIEVLVLKPAALVGCVRSLEELRLLSSDDQLIKPSHWLITESLRNPVTAVSTRVLHFEIARLLEREAEASSDAAQMWESAEHWLAAGEPRRSLTMVERCGAHALAIGRPRQAAELYLKAAALADADEQRDIAVKAMRIAEEAMERDIVCQALAFIHPQTLHPRNGDIELYELTSKAYARCDDQETINRLRDFVHGGAVRSTHRLVAGTALLICADCLRSAELANEVFRALEPEVGLGVQRDEVDALTVSLIYHAGFGDVEFLGQIAERFAALARTAPDATAARFLGRAAAGFWRNGNTAASMRAYSDGYECARRSGMTRTQMYLSLSAATLAQDLGDDMEVDKWLEFAESPEGRQHYHEAFDYFQVTTEVAFMRRDVERVLRAREFIAPRLTDFDYRARRWLNIADYWMKLQRGDWLSAGDAARELTMHHRRRLEVGGASDDEAAVAADILRSSGDYESAANLISAYLAEFRRGRAPLSAMLQMSIEALPTSGNVFVPEWARFRHRLQIERTEPTVAGRVC